MKLDLTDLSSQWVLVCLCPFPLPSGTILDSIVCEVKPSVVLELGTYCGYSAVRIASMLPPNARLITLEFNPVFAAIARQVIAWAGVEDKVRREDKKNTQKKQQPNMSSVSMCLKVYC